MDITRSIQPGQRTGTAVIPASKSRAHRLLIMAALSEKPVTLECSGFSNDILATINCLNALGCNIITENDSVIHVEPIACHTDDGIVKLPCRDSGSTLRFLLPLAGALGVNAVFEME